MKFNSFIHYTLALILLLNSNLIMYLGNHSLNTFNDNLSDDSLLICTGSESILISSFEYFTNNQIVEINPEFQTSSPDICPVDVAVEPSQFNFFSLQAVALKRGAFHAVSTRIFNFLNSNKLLTHKLTRAPPTL